MIRILVHKCKAKQNRYLRLHLLKVKQVPMLLKQQKPRNRNIILIISSINIIKITSITPIEMVKVIKRNRISTILGRKLQNMIIEMIYGL